ncbi:hypothetical protein NMY22_g273 [Coprinellus aureogranulatus]|nr:hypothetical protein NMY22_g273 [Coprinellus aureogranulatus]
MSGSSPPSGGLVPPQSSFGVREKHKKVLRDPKREFFTYIWKLSDALVHFVTTVRDTHTRCVHEVKACRARVADISQTGYTVYFVARSIISFTTTIEEFFHRVAPSGPSSDVLHSFVAKPREINPGISTIAKPGPMPPAQAKSPIHHHDGVTETQSQKRSHPTSQGVSQRDSEEYEDDDIPFVEAALSYESRRIQRACQKRKTAHGRSTMDSARVTRIGNMLRIPGLQASSDLVANYVETVPEHTIKIQQERITMGQRTGQPSLTLDTIQALCKTI